VRLNLVHRLPHRNVRRLRRFNQEEIRSHGGVKDVRVSFEKKEAWVKFDDQKISVAQLLQVIAPGTKPPSVGQGFSHAGELGSLFRPPMVKRVLTERGRPIRCEETLDPGIGSTL